MRTVRDLFEHYQTAVLQKDVDAFLSIFDSNIHVFAEGTPLRSRQNRLTWVLQKKAGQWKIVHEHTAAPIDHQSGKAILKR